MHWVVKEGWHFNRVLKVEKEPVWEELGNLLGKGIANAKTQRHGQIWGVQGTEEKAVGLEVGEHLASFIRPIIWLILLLESPSFLLRLQGSAQVVPSLRSSP